MGKVKFKSRTALHWSSVY